MDRRDIIIGFTILIILAGIVYWVSRPETEVVPTPTPVPIEEIEKRLEEQFKREVPEAGEKKSLIDVTGGDASGIVVRNVEDAKTNVSLLADLPDLESGTSYQAWLFKEEPVGEVDKISLGVLQIAKGGFSLEFSSMRDLEGFDKVAISLEKILDNTEEARILEASFSN